MTDKKPANHKKSLLKTKIKDLTQADIAQLEQPLGTSTHPFPMYGTERVVSGGQADQQQALSVIADDKNPIVIYSERPYDEVVAMAYCDMPVPSMLPLFLDGLERRRPENANRTQMFIGDPGFGKSFTAAMQGRLRSAESVDVFDCGGKNMNELLFEMVLDFGSGDALPTAIDKRLEAGTLEALSVGELKMLPKAAVTLNDDDSIAAIDWNYFRGQAKQDEVESAFEILKKVSSIEGLDNATGNALGMNSQYGPLIRAFIEGREIVLDEYNKSKEGSDNALQTVLQFLNGEKSSCTVDNPLKNKDLAAGPASFTFRRDDMQVGFFVTFTGNKTEDGITTRSLNESVYSRLSPQTLPDPTEADWQHRWCQILTGVPVSTLYLSMKDSADANPEAFGEWLMDLRETKARVDGVPVTDLQRDLLQNWQNVVHATEKLAKVYSGWAEMTDAAKIVSAGHMELIEEIDEEYSKKEGMDFRKIKQHVDEVASIRPHMLPSNSSVAVDFANFMKKPDVQEKEPESQALFFGTRLADFLERLAYEKAGAVGKPKLYEGLKNLMKDAGLRDIVLSGGGAHSGQKSVEEDLNISPFAGNDLNKQAELGHKVLCDYLRQVDENISTDNNEEIVTLSNFRKALRAVSKEDAAETHQITVVNRDYESLSDFPLVEAHIEDMATHEPDEEDAGFTWPEMVTHDDFMASLALPVVSGKNIEAVWEQNVRALQMPNERTAEADEVLVVAENRSPDGMATTTLMVAFNDAATNEVKAVPVHIVLNKNRNKALVIGEKLPGKLANAFKEAGITYVDRSSANARAQAETALNELTRGLPDQDSVKERLNLAFAWRNDVSEDSRSLSERLVANDIEPMFAKYVVRNKARPAA